MFNIPYVDWKIKVNDLVVVEEFACTDKHGNVHAVHYLIPESAAHGIHGRIIERFGVSITAVGLFKVKAIESYKSGNVELSYVATNIVKSPIQSIGNISYKEYRHFIQACDAFKSIMSDEASCLYDVYNLCNRLPFYEFSSFSKEIEDNEALEFYDFAYRVCSAYDAYLTARIDDNEEDYITPNDLFDEGNCMAGLFNLYAKGYLDPEAE